MQNDLLFSRRSFLKFGSAALAAAALPLAAPSLVQAMPRFSGMKALSFRNLHTDERLSVTYWKDGDYDHRALSKINHILRDHRVNETFPMHIGLMDLLHDLQRRLRDDSPIEIISGYRSPRTNTLLANASDGVARRSYHMKGMAIDIRLGETSLRRLRTEALFMARGGVGFYPRSDFVHLDVGPVRKW